MKLSGKCGLDRTECSPRDLGEASQPGGGEKSGVDGQKSGKRVGIWQNGRGGSRSEEKLGGREAVGEHHGKLNHLQQLCPVPATHADL